MFDTILGASRKIGISTYIINKNLGKGYFLYKQKDEKIIEIKIDKENG